MFGFPIQNKDSEINALTTFLFDIFELKEKDHIRRKIHSEKSVYMRNKCYYYYFDLAKIRVGWARTTKN